MRPWVLKLSLAFGGTILGLVLLLVALRVLPHKNEGVEFDSVDDFRKALTSEKAGQIAADGVSVNMAGIVRPNSDDAIIYDLKPNLSVMFAGVPLKTNSFGMRNRETTKEKPPGVFRIAMLGDSFAFGWGVNSEDSFPSVLERELQKSAPTGTKIEVLNFGVPGYSTFQEVEAFKTWGSTFNPDAVIVFFIENDFDFPFFLRDPSSSGGLVSRFGIHPDLLQNSVVQKMMRSRGWDPNSSLKQLDIFGRQNKMRVFVTINPRKAYKDCVRQLTVFHKRPTIHFLDIYKEFVNIVATKNYSQDDLNLPKDPHPTPLRHRIYGELMTEKLSHELGWR